eukprot:scaffold4069_cov85-Cyclotella_meneghiniana.AAC.2
MHHRYTRALTSIDIPLDTRTTLLRCMGHVEIKAVQQHRSSFGCWCYELTDCTRVHDDGNTVKRGRRRVGRSET